MPRTPKRGIDFSGWSVNIFDGDKKIDKLLDAQGWKGFGVYFYLCQSAYKLNGYYLEWDYDDSATTARKMGGGVGSETVSETVKLCLQIGLFDNRLFDRWRVLTSRGIQKRFWAAAGGRRAVPLNKHLWILAPEEAEGLNKVARFENMSPTNADMSPTNADMSPTNAPKGKESKAKEIKRDKREKKRPTREEVRAYAKSRGQSETLADRFFDYFDAGDWIDSKGNPVQNWKQKFITWEAYNSGAAVDKKQEKAPAGKAKPDRAEMERLKKAMEEMNG